jgi:hypothetical protein
VRSPRQDRSRSRKTRALQRDCRDNATVHQADHKKPAPTTGKCFINTRGITGVTNEATSRSDPVPTSSWGTLVKLALGEWTHHPATTWCLTTARCERTSPKPTPFHDNNIDIDAENPAGTSPWMSVD